MLHTLPVLLMLGLLSRHPHMPPCVNALLYTGTRDNPAAGFSLRAIDPERYQIVNEAAGGAVIEEIEESKAFFEVYDGAVYLYQARQCTVHVACMEFHLLLTRAAFCIHCCALAPLADDKRLRVVGGHMACPWWR